ncbi:MULTISPECIES: phage tail protein [unclassified Pseudomonas]|uniref:phage tail protein n=1 Tax=unclassified Pseudomonas TaxID=196821 RepID=UPI0021BB7A0B|nr:MULTISPECIES: phage tail protein [unclassified Pseudomonas]MCT8165023.1 phage tail protein [Pseudomonas sp. HD6422]MCT8183921.1 phage tail protein [Pseudomonas sp. HD6421]
MPWYRTGTVAITAGQTTVTGTGTAFALNARVGDAFQGPDGRWYEVTNIASATVLSILPAYQGATVSGGAYGLAPMQGYVKESADRLRQLVDQLGATFALFGGATNIETLRQNILAATRGANSDITSLSGLTTALSVAQGGTGGKTQAAARTGLGLGAAAVAAILGTVSQSGGVPTGAIVERGSNANGEYVKFADGTAIAMRDGTTSSFSATGSLYASDAVSRDLPMTFASVPRVYCADASTVSLWGTGIATTSTVSARLYSPTLPSLVARVLQIVAIGRWF